MCGDLYGGRGYVKDGSATNPTAASFGSFAGGKNEAGQSAVAFCAARSQLPAVRAAFAGFRLVAFFFGKSGNSRFSNPVSPATPHVPTVLLVAILEENLYD